MLRLIAVTALPGYKLRVAFDDGISGEVDLSHLVGKGVFVAWHDPAAFEKVSIGDQGELVWNGDIDLCPDALYLEISGESAVDVFPGLKVSSDA